MFKIHSILFVLLVASLFALSKISGISLVFAAEEKQVPPATESCDCPECSEQHEDQQGGEHEDHAGYETREGGHEDCEHDHEATDDHIRDEEVIHKEDEHVDCEHGHEVETGNTIALDHESQALIGIRTVKAQPGSLDTVIRLTGKIKLNADNVAHIIPLTPGIVRKANKTIGDRVKKDEVLAWIESAELGQAKVNYLDIQAELGCCSMNRDRAQQIHDDTLKLIEILKSKPALDEIGKIEGLEMGENRSVLIKAYAEYVFAQSVYEREKPLYEQKISSKQEYLNAEYSLKKAEAEYMATLDTIQFQVKQDFLETSSVQQRQEIALKGAERTLYVLGQTKDDIQGLDVLAQNLSDLDAQVPACPDPNCQACRKKAELEASNPTSVADFQHLGWYPLRASFDGTVIDKHITLGERLGEESLAFIVADLKTVWIDLDVFPNDLPFVARGQTCYITTGGQTLEGTISFISPVLDSNTRTATARLIVDNAEDDLRPGLFVAAMIYGKAAEGALVIPAEAVQTVNGKSCVFINDGADYELCPVILGRGNADHVEILSGLHPGDKVVTQGAFDLKAKVVTSTLDSHAGHGH